MEKTMVTKVISELKSISRLFEKLDPGNYSYAPVVLILSPTIILILAHTVVNFSNSQWYSMSLLLACM